MGKTPHQTSYRRRKWSRLFLLGFFIWFCIFVSNETKPDSLENELGSQADELARVRRELNEKRKSLERLNQMEKWAFAEFLELEERIELNERLIRRLIAKEKSMERELQTGDENLKETELELCSRREHFERRMREVYKHGRFGPCNMIFAASSPLGLIDGHRSVRRVLMSDQEMLKAARTVKADLEERGQNLGKAKPQVSWSRKRRAEERTVQRKNLEEREKLLKKIKSEKRLTTQAIRELEEEVSQISKILGFLREEDTYNRAKEGEGKSWFETLRGKLPWPVGGRVVSHFGERRHPRFHTKTENSGIEIEAEPGTEVVAVAEGSVIYVSRLRGYGNFLILKHDDEYYTLYACLSEVLVSAEEEVERLQRIGSVGEGGVISVPYLHFEIRKGRKSQDPLEWLR
jgi:septal ring factor EnvC (AmiA/AmiB activator)